MPTATAPAASLSSPPPPLQVTVEGLQAGSTVENDPVVQGRAVEALSTLLGLPNWPAEDQASWAERGVVTTTTTTTQPSSTPSQSSNSSSEETKTELNSQGGAPVRGLLLPQGPCRGSLTSLKPTLRVLASALRVLELRGNPHITGNLEVHSWLLHTFTRSMVLLCLNYFGGDTPHGLESACSIPLHSTGATCSSGLQGFLYEQRRALFQKCS